MVRKLGDGTTITQERNAFVARDSEGRLRDEEQSLGPASLDSVADHMTLITITDPVARKTIRLNIKKKTANIWNGAGSVLIGPGQPHEPVASMAGGLLLPIEVIMPSHWTVEELGTKTIEGITVQGTRKTNVVPINTIGNDRQMTMVREMWKSPELGVVLLSKTEDPRDGVTTTEYSNIRVGEPDPALFQVPSDYTIEDRTLPQKTVLNEPK
jgi:hypothetical protein